MKATDLMIGDWVLYTNTPYKIRELGIFAEDRDGNDYPAVCIGKTNCIGLIVERNEIEPIPLTPEILEKNGFVRDMQEEEELKSILSENFCGFYKIPNIPNKYVGFYLESWNDKLYTITDHQLMRIHYVHELQHALKLCEIEKEIIL